VAACGVCHSDLHVAKGDIPFITPCVLGHEISGLVESLGPGVTGIRPGQRAVASFIMPCGRCAFCERGRDDLCETYFSMNRKRGVLYDGETRLFRADGAPVWMQMMGGLAERAVVPATDVFPLPEHLPLEESCILGCAVMTAYGALRHAAQLLPGETVALVGSGGVGSNLVQLARHLGAREVMAIDVRDEKLEEARKLGATRTVNAVREDPVEAVRGWTKGAGVDVAVEALGRPETVVQAFTMTRDGGRTVVVGVAPAGSTAPIELGRLVRRGIRLVGSFGCRVRADMPEIIRLASDGKIELRRPVTRRYRLEEAQEAFDALGRGDIVGRAIVVL
jgi:S-(hydroxymethyl)glutathione dehydrogenase/alcohol dehydrogenase